MNEKEMWMGDIDEGVPVFVKVDEEVPVFMGYDDKGEEIWTKL